MKTRKECLDESTSKTRHEDTVNSRITRRVDAPSQYTGRIQCKVLTTLPFYFSWIEKFLGQQLKI